MVIIYGSKNCSWCTRALELCKDYGVDTAYHDIYEGRNKDTFRELFPEATTVPQIIFNGEHIGGYAELDRHLTQSITLH